MIYVKQLYFIQVVILARYCKLPPHSPMPAYCVPEQFSL